MRDDDDKISNTKIIAKSQLAATNIKKMSDKIFDTCSLR
jgi:hypothetical protein